jgi:hypothetical protein
MLLREVCIPGMFRRPRKGASCEVVAAMDDSHWYDERETVGFAAAVPSRRDEPSTAHTAHTLVIPPPAGSAARPDWRQATTVQTTNLRGGCLGVCLLYPHCCVTRRRRGGRGLSRKSENTLTHTPVYTQHTHTQLLQHTTDCSARGRVRPCGGRRCAVRRAARTVSGWEREPRRTAG